MRRCIGVRRPSSSPESSEVGDGGSSGSVVPAGPGRSTDRTKVIGVVAPVGRAYLDDALALWFSLRPRRTRAPVPLPVPVPLPEPVPVPVPALVSIHTMPWPCYTLQFRSVPFRPVRSIARRVSHSSSRFSSRLALPSPCSLALCLSFLLFILLLLLLRAVPRLLYSPFLRVPLCLTFPRIARPALRESKQRERERESGSTLLGPI